MLANALLALIALLLVVIYVRLCMIGKVVGTRPVAVPAPTASPTKPLTIGDIVLAEVVAAPVADSGPALSHHCGHTHVEHVEYEDGTRACPPCHEANR